MEWPHKMTLTDGSMVGEGVPFATSRSMTLFCNLHEFSEAQTSGRVCT